MSDDNHRAFSGPAEAINGRLEALRGNALGFRILTHSRALTPTPRSTPPTRHCAAGQSPYDSAVGNLFAGLWTGVREVLRTLSYPEMQNRAGLIGQQGRGPMLANLAGPSGAARIHLIGHGFGAGLPTPCPVLGLRSVVGITCRM